VRSAWCSVTSGPARSTPSRRSSTPPIRTRCRSAPRTCTAALGLLDPASTEGPIALDEASYFLSKIELKKGPAPTMPIWRKRLFIATAYVTADAAEYLGLPRDRTVIMGSQIDV
jgi:hypothetical protein